MLCEFWCNKGVPLPFVHAMFVSLHSCCIVNLFIFSTKLEEGLKVLHARARDITRDYSQRN